MARYQVWLAGRRDSIDRTCLGTQSMLWATFDSQELVRRGHVFVRYSLRQVLRMGLKTAIFGPC